MDRKAAWIVSLLLVLSAFVVVTVTADHDGDMLDDSVEELICEPPALEGPIESILVNGVLGGECEGEDLQDTIIHDFDPNDLGTDLTNDTDNDTIPDGGESAICEPPVAEDPIQGLLNILGVGTCDDEDFDVDEDPDDDGDNIPDGPEAYLCTTAVTRDLIETVMPGSCDRGNLTLDVGGLDADGDGLPDTAESAACGAAADPINDTGVGTCNGGNLTLTNDPGTIVDSIDGDGDGIPDALEGVLCGNSAVADLINQTGAATCDGDDLSLSEDFDPDQDGDLLVDAAEATVCGDPAVADAINDSGAGTCNGGNLTLDATGLVTGLIEDEDADGLPDALEAAVCNDATLRGLVESSGQGSCDDEDLTLTPTAPPVGPPSDTDGDGIPDLLESALCGTNQMPAGLCEDRNGDGTKDDIHAENALDTSMGTVLNPVCTATGNQPAQVCVMRFMTVGQAACFLRNQVPVGAGAFVGCSAGGEPWVHCSRETNPGELVLAVASDADCDDASNGAELDEGCNPIDPTQNPGSGAECELDPTGGLADLVSCGGSSDPLTILYQVISDADCDRASNAAELEAGCNPLLASEYPGNPESCTLDAVGGIL